MQKITIEIDLKTGWNDDLVSLNKSRRANVLAAYRGYFSERLQKN